MTDQQLMVLLQEQYPVQTAPVSLSKDAILKQLNAQPISLDTQRKRRWGISKGLAVAALLALAVGVFAITRGLFAPKGSMAPMAGGQAAKEDSIEMETAMPEPEEAMDSVTNESYYAADSSASEIAGAQCEYVNLAVGEQRNLSDDYPIGEDVEIWYYEVESETEVPVKERSAVVMEEEGQWILTILSEKPMRIVLTEGDFYLVLYINETGA